MVTPPASTSITSPNRFHTKSGRGPQCSAAQERSASPDLKEKSNLDPIMKRTPQPTLTQSKLTSMLQGPPAGGSVPDVPARPTLTTDQVEMDTSAPPAQATTSVASSPAIPPMTAEFFLKALKDNSDHIIKSFNASLGALSQRIDDNAGRIANNSSAISSLTTTSEAHRTELSHLSDRVAMLERGGGATVVTEEPAVLSPEYLFARRSVRLWPIPGGTDEEIWESVGEFLHDSLAIREDDLCQDDIESIERVATGRLTDDRKEALVTFVDRQKRDAVMSSSSNLASKVDREGKPTAGIRLEIPKELDGTFRLLSRFGTRLRARHGTGTKRHIKFDDYTASLYTNIKLPGDNSWTRITPRMAKEDLEASVREENSQVKKRMALKLVPGPRDRLSVPVQDARITAPPLLRSKTPNAASAPTPAPSGKRPRWSVPDRRGRL